MTKRERIEPATKEFLGELRERARWFGWDGDYVEVARFVRELYAEAGLSITDEELEPYEEE